jgi:succinate-semialdehyde dehydrogenase/glutarate-semialdehyde dehydrogenase
MHDPSSTHPREGRGSFRSIAPTNGEVLGRWPSGGASEAREVVIRAARAQQAWREQALSRRCKALLRFRDTLVARAEEVVDVVVRETGCPRHEALLFDVAVTADLITHTARIAPRVLAPEEIPLRLLRHRKSYVHPSPRGVVAVLTSSFMPFGFPLSAAVPALIAGSAVVLKPSRGATATAMLARSLWSGSDLPADLLNVLTGDGETGRHLIAGGVDLVFFSGSSESGREAAISCADKGVPLIRVADGGASLIACQDADVGLTSRGIVDGGFAHLGQSPVSVERVFAHRDVHERLVVEVVTRCAALSQGDPAARWADLGALADPTAARRLRELIGDAVEHGATVRTGGDPFSRVDAMFPPTVLSGCNMDMRVMRETLRGPVVAFMEVGSDEQALEIVNAGGSGLAAYVFSTDRERARGLAERARAGNVEINDVSTTLLCPEVPFSDGRSGLAGTLHGDDILMAMCERRHVSVDRVRPLRRNPFGFPYSAERYRWLLKGMRTLFSGGDVLQKLGELL